MEALRLLLADRRDSGADSIVDIARRLDATAEKLQVDHGEDGVGPYGSTRDQLIRAIEDTVIPKLIVSHCARKEAARLEPVPEGPDEGDVAQLTTLILAHDGQAIAALIRRLRQTGQSVDVLCLDLLAPAARHLGDLWVRDVCGFTEVTIGLLQLHDLLRFLCQADAADGAVQARANQILLVLTPGEQHMFGLSMVAEFFRKAGWNVQVGYPETMVQLGRMVSADLYHIVGLSCGSEARMESAATAVRMIRRGATREGVLVMAGGPVFVEHPEFGPAIGADVTVLDGREAVHEADRNRAGCSEAS